MLRHNNYDKLKTLEAFSTFRIHFPVRIIILNNLIEYSDISIKESYFWGFIKHISLYVMAI
jgi:hypothetical protein